MLKLILANFLISLTIVCIPTQTIEYKRVEAQIQPKISVKQVKKTKVAHYAPPVGPVALIAKKVSDETGVPCETINKIMFAESHYDINAKHINKNGSIDSGLFQINSQHIPLAVSLGLDINDPDDNAEFAIYLIKESGLSPWIYSQKTWSKI